MSDTHIVAGAVVLYFDRPLPEGDMAGLDFVPVRAPNGDSLGVGRVSNVEMSDDRCRLTMSLDFSDLPSLDQLAEMRRDA